jgi:hypothetical protein
MAARRAERGASGSVPTHDRVAVNLPNGCEPMGGTIPTGGRVGGIHMPHRFPTPPLLPRSPSAGAADLPDLARATAALTRFS